MAFSMSELLLTILPTAVAAASARLAEGDTIVTASAVPKISKEGPTVPDEVHTPSGLLSVDIFIPMRLLKEELPAKTPDSYLPVYLPGTLSPPFSTITSSHCFSISRPAYSATAPATAAIGPTPAAAARSISCIMSGAHSAAGSGIRLDKNSG